MDTLTQQLAAPLNPKGIRWKPITVSGDRALVVPYADVKTILQRLDEVCGCGGWQDSYEQLLPSRSFLCKLSIKVGDTWVTKTDVGTCDSKDTDQEKAAVGDALKRAAFKFGIGRALKYVSKQWVAYSQAEKRIAGTPILPPWALPAKTTAA